MYAQVCKRTDLLLHTNELYLTFLNEVKTVPRERFFFIGWADSTDGWVDSIRQVDVDLNFLLVLYSTVGLTL